MRVGQIVVAGIFAGSQHTTQRMPFVNRPGHDQHIGAR